ncbi:MAG: biosynthetic-type acetolactate synthase large subunit [Thermaerobacter sp.]|nr:biosynthetic-type acetolactate synthase large subunit [Thermaerobacter sp.]
MVESGARTLLQCLQEEGVEVIFGYPGGAVLPIYDALYDSPIRHILVRHEQGAVHAADGYARVSGRTGVCLATSGPGATNLVTGLATAQMDSIPLVAVTGQVARPLIGTDAFQEVDTLGVTRAITKHSYLVDDARDIPRIVHEAYYIARTGRPGPVLIDIPKNVALQRGPFEHPAAPPGRRGYRFSTEPEGAAVEAAAQAIAAAERPLLIVGGGVIHSGSEESLRRLMAALDAPAASTLMGLGAVHGTDPRHLGLLGMHGTYAANRATAHADLIIGLGLRFDDRVTGSTKHFAPKAKIIHFDIDEAEIEKIVRVDFPVLGDLRYALPALEAAIARNPQTASAAARSAWWEEIREWEAHQGWTALTPMELGGENGSLLRPQAVIQEIYKATDGEAVVVTDVGQHQMWTALLYPFARARQFVTSGGLGTMGFGLPAALGAQMARPDASVWLVSGDGSIQMNIQEMATATNYGLPVRVVVINNHQLGMVRQWQELFHQERYSAVHMTDLPDYRLLAEAYGWKGMRVETAQGLREALLDCASEPGPVILDVVVEPQENVFPMVPAGASLADVLLEKPQPAERS